MNKRWKGLLWGLLIQPFVIAVIFALVVFGIYFYQKYDFRKQREAAMVSVKKTDADGNTHIWYLKPNEECFYECREKGEEAEFFFYDKVKLLDVVPLDSARASVDDVIVVSFDIDRHVVTAVDYEEPMDVVSVNWDKVKDYLQKHS